MQTWDRGQAAIVPARARFEAGGSALPGRTEIMARLLRLLIPCLTLLSIAGCRRTYVASPCMEPLIPKGTAVSFEPPGDRRLARGASSPSTRSRISTISGWAG